jgi:hypothetical protein
MLFISAENDALVSATDIKELANKTLKGKLPLKISGI